MGLRQCEKCEELVDDAKAFCPGCGNSLVEERSRTQASNFDAADHTMQLGQTMYNQMLSDMGLNISKGPDPAGKRSEIIAPIATEVKRSEVRPAVPEKPSGNMRWIIAGLVLLVLFLLIALVIAAIGLIYWTRFR